MNIVLTGSVAFDYLMSFPGYFRDHILPDKLDSLSLSFLVESLVRQQGGTAPNIAYTLALLGEHPRIYATVGEDFDEYRSRLESHGVDTSVIRVIPGESTASFFASTDRSNAQIASFYPGAMAHAAELSLHDLDGEKPDVVMISPNDPAAMARYVVECQEMSIPYLYDPSQQIPRLKSTELRQGVEGSLALFVNDYELSMIQNRISMGLGDIRKLTKFTVVTRGELGATVYDGEQIYDIPAVVPQVILDPTGVGDAFRGGFLTGYAHGLDLRICGKLGVLAATYCIEGQGPQGHTYTQAEFLARFRSQFDDKGVLDKLFIAG